MCSLVLVFFGGEKIMKGLNVSHMIGLLLQQMADQNNLKHQAKPK